jgi:hypothetical protein
VLHSILTLTLPGTPHLHTGAACSAQTCRQAAEDIPQQRRAGAVALLAIYRVGRRQRHLTPGPLGPPRCTSFSCILTLLRQHPPLPPPLQFAWLDEFVAKCSHISRKYRHACAPTSLFPTPSMSLPSRSCHPWQHPLAHLLHYACDIIALHRDSFHVRPLLLLSQHWQSCIWHAAVGARVVRQAWGGTGQACL